METLTETTVPPIVTTTPQVHGENTNVGIK